MANFEPLSKGIYCIDSGYIRDELAAIYLLQQDQEVAIIETGTFHSIPNVLSVMSELGIGYEQIKYIIPTHIHLDHAGGVSGMMELFPHARLIVHPRGARHMVDPSRLISGSIAVYGEEAFHRLYGEIKPVDANRIDIAEDLDRFSLAGRDLLFIDTPGHAKHHFCIFDETSRGFFTGDTFGLSYPGMKDRRHGLVPTTTPIDFNPEALIKSVDRLLDFEPERMYLTHFGEITNPADKVDDFKAWISDFIDLCESINPVDSTSTRKLEEALHHLVVEKLGSETAGSNDALLDLMKTDIQLNADGLAIWWKSLGHA